MNKLKMTLLATALLVAGMKTSFGQALEKGDVAFNTYYGVNLLTGIFKAAYENSGGSNGSTQTEFKIKGLGPIGLSGEYMVTDKVGLGADVYYANTSISWKETYDEYNNTTMLSETKTYDYKVSIPRFAALFRANLHFTNDDKFDSYGIIAAGYKNLAFKYETNDPSYNFATVKSLIPVGIKLGIGFRYFFTDNLGINAEIAAGTPLICGGISAKF